MGRLSSRAPRSLPGFDRLESRDLLAAGPGRAAVEGRAAHPPAMTNLVYNSDAFGSQRLDVRVPAGPAPAGGWPVVVAIHGGGWRGGDKLDYEAKVAPTLLADGFAVVAPDYTLSTARRPGWPEELSELRQAVRWVRANASKFAFDPGHVAAMGESAGGHLALMLGADQGPVAARVDAVVDFFGPADLATLDREGSAAAPAVTEFLGGPAAKFPARYVDASPVTHVSPQTPPVLIVHGTDDPLVSYEQSVELDQFLTSKGVPHQFISVDGAKHGFGLVVDGIDLRPAVTAFLDRTLGG